MTFFFLKRNIQENATATGISMPDARLKPRVTMIGLRGIPNVEGGIEKHVEQLSYRLAQKGWDVEVIARAPYVNQPQPYMWRGVRVRPLWAPKTMRFETILHTFLCLGIAMRRRPDILHIHAIGPALVAPFARLLGLNVVVTHHGFDYDREKWSWLDKKALRLGEWIGMKSAHGRIGVSQDIARTVERRYGVPIRYVPNGVAIEHDNVKTDVLKRFGLKHRRYVVMVSRLVPEKRQLDLIAAYARLRNPSTKLVIVGNGDMESSYGRKLRDLAQATPGVILTGTQTGADLAALYRHANVFVLPSSHEGMPIVVLEALAYGVPVIVSDIPANLELGLRKESYFPLGNIEALAAALAEKLSSPAARATVEEERRRVERDFGWSRVSDETMRVYEQVGRERGLALEHADIIRGEIRQ